MRVEGLTIMYYTAWEENLWVLDKGSGNYKYQSQANEHINGKGFKWHFLFFVLSGKWQFWIPHKGRRDEEKTDRQVSWVLLHVTSVYISHSERQYCGQVSIPLCLNMVIIPITKWVFTLFTLISSGRFSLLVSAHIL